ncbi:hypothetical protein Taro_003563 [Colocasia esculenta]|uniref:Uncharacterized protein n=1 Tax=Colocasia esculenta TaxID=4460 RepID=A0A843TP63_COLES|nr:hypothetical protein [Colocasia esculenta]
MIIEFDDKVDKMQVSSMKTCKSRKGMEEKCYMAHGSSRGSSRSDESEGSHLSKKSINSQMSSKSNSDPFDASISNSDSDVDISYDELIECYEHLSNQLKKVKAQNMKLKENLDKNEMRIDNAEAFYGENEKLKMENEKLENEVKNYGIMFSKLKEDHDQVESENFDLKIENEKLIDHIKNLKFDNDQLIKQISNIAHDHQIKENCNQLVEENRHLKKKIKCLCHDRPLNYEWNNSKKKITILENQIVQSKNVQEQNEKLNKNAAKRKNHVSIQSQKKKMEKKTGVYKVSTSPLVAHKASRQSPTPHHAKSYQRVPPPSSQHKGDQRYSKGSQRFQQMQSHYGKLQCFTHKAKMMKKWSSGVDTGSSSVDTSPNSQRSQLTARGRSISRVELKSVCPSFKLLHQLIPVKTKLEVLLDDHHEEFFIWI